MMLFLTTVWVLLVMPNPSSSIPHPEEFRVHSAYFSSVEDCDAAAKKWMPDLSAAAVDRKHLLKWDNWGDRSPPADVSVTYSCVEEERL